MQPPPSIQWRANIYAPTRGRDGAGAMLIGPLVWSEQPQSNVRGIKANPQTENVYASETHLDHRHYLSHADMISFKTLNFESH